MQRFILAPEVLNDEPCGVQADVWSIGALIATLYEFYSLKKIDRFSFFFNLV